VLTAKQEKFCQSIADGMNQSDAYRAAYSAGNMKDSSINVKASELMADGKLKVRVKELQSALADKALWTREDSVLGLRSIAMAGKSKANEITAAIKELNLMHGYQAPLKSELTVKGGLVLIPAKNG
jgi:phage terminase small subunit